MSNSICIEEAYELMSDWAENTSVLLERLTPLIIMGIDKHITENNLGWHNPKSIEDIQQAIRVINGLPEWVYMWELAIRRLNNDILSVKYNPLSQRAIDNGWTVDTLVEYLGEMELPEESEWQKVADDCLIEISDIKLAIP